MLKKKEKKEAKKISTASVPVKAVGAEESLDALKSSRIHYFASKHILSAKDLFELGSSGDEAIDVS